MSVDEFDAWVAARKRVEAVANAADEEGGPSVSLVPAVEQDDAWPTDLLSPAAGTGRLPLPRPLTVCLWKTAASGSPAGAPSANAPSSAISPRPGRSTLRAARRVLSA